MNKPTVDNQVKNSHSHPLIPVRLCLEIETRHAFKEYAGCPLPNKFRALLTVWKDPRVVNPN